MLGFFTHAAYQRQRFKSSTNYSENFSKFEKPTIAEQQRRFKGSTNYFEEF
jgi:hypothetical protein